MADSRASRKYQVYFFLYLAVICELLIIIVERDDAELKLRRERDQLLQLTKKIVTELMETTPVQSLNGSNQMEVGETRRFVIMLQGIGPEDEVTIPPEIIVSRGGQPMQRLKLGTDIVPVSDQSQNGKRVFAFNWRAPSPGVYEFKGESSINRLGILPTGEVKIASLSFPYEVIASLVPDLPSRINEFERLEADLTVKVLAAGDQLLLNGGRMVTAVGFPATGFVEVQGTAAEKVRINPSHGSVALQDGRLLWQGRFEKPGSYTVTLDGRDVRNAGALSRSQSQFHVDVRWPASTSTTSHAFAGEQFRKNIAVAGLEDRTQYRWRATLDGGMIAEGKGTMAAFDLGKEAAGKTLVVDAAYDGRVYPVATDDRTIVDSRFTYTVLDAPARIRNLSFSRSGEYPVNQEFRFDAWTCGSCTQENRRAAENVSVDAASANGGDVLDDYLTEPILDADGRIVGTRVKFYLKGRVARDGEDVLLTLRAGDTVEKIPVVIYPE